MNEIEGLIFGDWRHQYGPMLDPRHWNIDRLSRKPNEWQSPELDEVARIRKPSIALEAVISIKDNLCFSWHPRTVDQNHDRHYLVGDWAKWPGMDRYGWSRPANEILYIKDIDRLRPGDVRSRIDGDVCNWDVLDELMIALIRSGYDWMHKMLSTMFDVEKISDFEFELVEPSPTDFYESEHFFVSPKRITKWALFDVEARRWQAEQAWIEKFKTEYGIEIGSLIAAYNNCLSQGNNRLLHNRSKYASADLQKQGVRLTPKEIDRIVERLKKFHPGYFHMIQPVQPTHPPSARR